MQKIIAFLTIFFSINFAHSEVNKNTLIFENIPLKKSVRDSIKAGDVFSESKVTDYVEEKIKYQSLQFKILGLHKKSCNYALKTLSDYEHFHKFLDFVKVSKYNSETEEIDFILSHMLLPYDMQLIFKLPRIKENGDYPFQFEIGFLKGLKGIIHVIPYSNRCLFFTEAKWNGPHTGHANLTFEFFSQGLSKISMELLFRISSTLSH
jgi:hypothetical protein